MSIRLEKKDAKDQFCYMSVFGEVGDKLFVQTLDMDFALLLCQGSVTLDNGTKQKDFDAPLLVPIRDDRDITLTAKESDTVAFMLWTTEKPSQHVILDFADQHGKIKEIT